MKLRTCGFVLLAAWTAVCCKVSDGRDPALRAERLGERIAGLLEAGRYAEAVPLAAELVENQERLFGTEDVETAYCLNVLGHLLSKAGRAESAVPHHSRALRIFQQTLGAEDPAVVDTLGALGFAWLLAGKPETAEPYLDRNLELSLAVYGPEHPRTADSLNNLGYLRAVQARVGEARSYYEQSLKISEKTIGRDHPRTSDVLANLARLLEDEGDLDGARRAYAEVLAIREKTLGSEHPKTARSHGDLGRVLLAQADAAGAWQAYQRAIEIVEGLDPQHPDRTRYLNGLGSVLKAQGDYEGARTLFESALALSRQLRGPEHPDTATGHTNVASVLEQLGELEEAESHYERALGLDRKLFGARHPHTANSLSNLGSVRERRGDFASAGRLYEEALSIREQRLGSGHPDTAITLTNLGHLLKAMGELAGAQRRYQRALAIRTEKLGPKHPKTAASLNNLAAALEARGDLARARELYEQALKIRLEIVGEEHPATAVSLNNLGLIVAAMGDPTLAAAFLSRALAIREEVYGPDHPEVATSLTNLGSLLRFSDEPENERSYLERALAIRLASLGAEHPATALSHHSLGYLLLRLGDLEGSRSHFERAVAIREKVLGPAHPDTASSLLGLAVLEEASGRLERAVALTARAVEIFERWLVPVLEMGSEADKRLFLRTLSGLPHRAVSLHLRSLPASREAARLALTTLLRHKGRALEAAVTGLQRLRRGLIGESEPLLQELAELRALQAALMLRPPTSLDAARLAERLTELGTEIRDREAELAERSAAFRQASEPIRLATLQEALSPDTALVEFFVFEPFDVRAKANPWGRSRYAAYVLRRSGAPAAVDLGETEVIDAAVTSFRLALANPRPDVRERARELDALTMAKVRPLLGEASVLVLAPDGDLNLVPFAALVDSTGSYLIERYRLSYVTSGSDLLVAGPVAEARQPPLIVGAPNFEAVPEFWEGDVGSASRQDDLPESLDPLPGAAAEARAIGRILGLESERVLTGRAATETAVKAARGPRILHLATHGFFLPDLVLPAPITPAPDLLLERAEETRDDVFLRSALALAGFDQRQAGNSADDGVLTALEVIGLDLWGTEIVTLSACETGVGKVRSGQGVFGLRRALILAGAGSQMMTLWKVDDESTRNLMESWYAQIRDGVGRAEALREVQLAFLRGQPLPKAPVARGVRPLAALRNKVDPLTIGTRHPSYWASFILVGESGSLRIHP